MVGTVGAARKLGGRRALLGSASAYAAGIAIGGLALFGALGLVGTVVHSRALWLGAAAVAGLCAACDLAGRRVRPQLRSQVPERWRRILPLPLATFSYGLILGTGLVTYVPATAAWALLALALAVGSVSTALAIGVALVAGRALPVVVLAALREGEESLGRLTLRPGVLHGVRVAAGASLVVGAVVVLAGPAGAARIVGAPAGDPSAADTDLVWQTPGVGGFLRRGAATTRLPGSDPAAGGALLAWRNGSTVTVAARATLAPVLQEPVPGVQKLAVSDGWLVYRAARRDGSARLVAQSLAGDGTTKLLAASRRGAAIGRPAIDGDVVGYAITGLRASSIVSVDLATGRRSVLRYSRNVQLANPSILGSRLLYVRTARCAQELRLRDLGTHRDRVLLALPALAGADVGHEHDHTSQGSRTPCGARPRTTTQLLWSTALAADTAYATILRPTRRGRTTPRLIAVSL